MRIAELSSRSGIPIPTIKYYLREGLIPPGEFTSPNQARYDERHIQRLQLIRTLLEIGRLPIATIKELLSDLYGPEANLHHAFGRALRSMAPDCDEVEENQEIDALIERHGWEVSANAPARQAVAEVIAALRRLGSDDLVARIDEYAAAADRVAQVDLEIIGAREDPESKVLGAVVGTVLGDALIAGLRRMAQESISAKIYHVEHAQEPQA